MTLLTLLLFAILFAGVAMTVNEGLWNNTVSLFCILLAGIVAVLAGVPLGNWAQQQLEKDDTFAWYFAFAGMWLTFALAVTVMRLITDRTSRLRVRFIPPLDKIAGPLMGLLVAVMMMSFTAYTLDRAPLAAGEWSYQDASPWQVDTFSYARTPFMNVVGSFASGEEISSPFLE